VLSTQPYPTTSPSPGIEDVRFGLSKALLGAYEPAWAEICRECGIVPDCTHLDAAKFDHLLEVLARRDPLCRVLAMSWRIRRTAFQKLEQIGRP